MVSSPVCRVADLPRPWSGALPLVSLSQAALFSERETLRATAPGHGLPWVTSGRIRSTLRTPGWRRTPMGSGSAPSQHRDAQCDESRAQEQGSGWRRYICAIRSNKKVVDVERADELKGPI